VHINKSAVALFTGVTLWVLAVPGLSGAPVEPGALTGHFEAVAELLFFLPAAMGLLKMDFVWCLKRISLPALLGYAAGVAWSVAWN
jgi:hypothetical protein